MTKTPKKNSDGFVDWFRASSPYIHAHSGRTVSKDGARYAAMATNPRLIDRRWGSPAETAHGSRRRGASPPI